MKNIYKTENFSAFTWYLFTKLDKKMEQLDLYQGVWAYTASTDSKDASMIVDAVESWKWIQLLELT